MQDVKVETAPAIGISLTHTVAENRNIVMQCFVPFDCDPKELNAALDKCFKASARQQAQVRLPIARKDLARLDQVYERRVEDMLRLDAEAEEANKVYAAQHAASGRRGEPPKNAMRVAAENKNAADRQNAETTLKRAKEDIALLTQEIADLEQTIAED